MMDKEDMKSFDNPRDCLKYLKTKAKEGEKVMLDERPTFFNPRRVKFFKKQKSEKKT